MKASPGKKRARAGGAKKITKPTYSTLEVTNVTRERSLFTEIIFVAKRIKLKTKSKLEVDYLTKKV